MPSVGFEPAIPASERPQIQELDRASTAIGTLTIIEALNLTDTLCFHSHTDINFYAR